MLRSSTALVVPALLALLFFVACAAGGPRSAGQAAGGWDDAPFELERLMRDPEWIARSPEDPWWAPDGRAVYFWRALEGQRTQRELVEVELGTGTERVLADEERPRAAAAGGEWDRARRRLVFVREGNLFLRGPDGLDRQLTRTRARDSDPMWLAGERRIAFRRGETWLARELETGLEEELAVLLTQDDPLEAEAKRLAERGFLELQQERLFDVVRERLARHAAARERERALEQADPTRAPRPWYLGKGQRVLHQSLSPDSGALAVRLGPERAREGQRDAMAEWITDSGLAGARDVRANVGVEARRAETLLVLDLATRGRIEVELGALPGLVAAAQEEEPQPAEPREVLEDPEALEEGAEPKGPRKAAARPPPLLFTRLAWSPQGDRLAVQARSLDNRQRWILVLEERGRTLRPVHHLVDGAWINGRFDGLGWLPDGSGLWFLSEESGWSQLHLWDAGSGELRALTAGEQEVDSVEAHPGGSWLYFRSNRDHPGVQEVWRVDPSGGTPERLTGHGGQLRYWPAPDGERLLLLASRKLEPPDLFVQDARPGAGARRLTSSVSAEFAGLPWVEPELVAVPTRHGVPAHGRLFLPPPERLGPAGRRPAVLFVHGAGYLQSAHAGWPRYLRETLFHTLLARRGALVLDLDYRASAGYGRDWRTAIHLKVGEPELDDLEDGVAWLAREHGVDPARVGVYGGSYGGFLVLQALFTRPELFACGAALRPVTDWAHYNHGYTANLLGLPEEQAEAYARSSPIEHAAGLARPLLIAHGLVDDNVLAKDSVRLVQRLIELGKQDWELAVYPAETHGFQEPSSWLDQYRRVLRLFERHLWP